MKSFDIVGYTYKADVYCPEDVVKEVCKNQGIEGHGLSHIPEEALDLMARFRGIDRYEEKTFDSDDFPKVIFADQDEGDICCICHEPLIGG